MKFRLLALFLCMSFASPGMAQDKKKGGPKSREEVIEQAVNYLKTSQSADGTWSVKTSPGITGLVLQGMLRSGKVTAADPVVAKGLKTIEAMIDAKEGHLAAGEGKIFHRNYITAVNLLAFQSADPKKYAAIIEKANTYLKNLQWDEGEEKTAKDPYYGGTGYGPGTRPDLSNTQFFLDAIKAAGTPASDPAYKKAIVFVSRCQNIKHEANDQPWATKIDDGSFIYVLGTPKGGKSDDAPRPGNGSMTAAGLKCFAMCGLDKNDKRFQKANDWLAKNYSVDMNPGQGAGAGMRAYYYYLATLAKCMDTLGAPEFVDAKGEKHDWRADITSALINRQRKDGSWLNETPAFQESNPDLCTAFALIALSYTNAKSK
jgi:squalene-hopene/tetraprenyl-beta-curcumene cyclase